MSPESLETAEASPKSDQFALATIIYECVAGASPFSKVASLRDMMMMKKSGLYQPLSIASPHAPRELSDAVRRGMAPNPQDRFASVQDFGLALRALASSMPTRRSCRAAG
jgi:serine/threonine-protein kinase